MSEVEIKCMQCGLSVDHFLELTDKMVSGLATSTNLQLPVTFAHARHLQIFKARLALRPPDHPGLPWTASCWQMP